MIKSRSNEETHARYCAARNVRSALFLIAFCLLIIYLDWRDLRKPYAKVTNCDLFWQVVVLAVSMQSLRIFTCLRERLVIAAATLIFVREIAFRFFAASLIPISSQIRQAFLVPWIFSLLISVTALASAMSRIKDA
jgi:hypothetical protein